MMLRFIAMNDGSSLGEKKFSSELSMMRFLVDQGYKTYYKPDYTTNGTLYRNSENTVSAEEVF